MWSPVMGSPLVRMLAHQAPITSLAVEKSGHYMVTSGMDKKVHTLLRLPVCTNHYVCIVPPRLDIFDKSLYFNVGGMFLCPLV